MTGREATCPICGQESATTHRVELGQGSWRWECPVAGRDATEPCNNAYGEYRCVLDAGHEGTAHVSDKPPCFWWESSPPARETTPEHHTNLYTGECLLSCPACSSGRQTTVCFGLPGCTGGDHDDACPVAQPDREASMTLQEAIDVTRERRNWLRARIEAKRSVGWDTEWDEREAEAHTVLLEHLTPPARETS